VVAWRDVPVDVKAVGPIALKTMPRIRQVFIESGAGLAGDELERALFIVRKRMEQEKVRGCWVGGWVGCGCYVCALGTEHVKAGQIPGLVMLLLLDRCWQVHHARHALACCLHAQSA
jgi:hypothetical protein